MHAPVRWCRLVLAACLLVAGSASASPSTTMFGFVLPHRGDSREVEEETRQVVEEMARRMNAQIAARPPALPLAARLVEARRLKQTGALDDAAALLDEVLEQGASAPHLIDDAQELISAHVRRATIALARGEPTRARALLARILRYDPLVEISSLESNPQSLAAFDDLRRQLGPSPSIEPADLGTACRMADVVVVVRRVAISPLAIELLRFDGCRRIAETILHAGDGADSEALRIGRAAAALVPIATPAPAASSIAKPALHRGKLIAGALVLAGGVALGATGGYFAVDASRRYHDVNGSCSPAAPCSGETLVARKTAYQNATALGSSLVPIGAAAIVLGAVLTSFGIRSRVMPSASVGADHLVLDASLAF